MKYVEKTEIYTDGFYSAHLHSHRRGYTITYFYQGAFRGDTDYFVSEYGSRACCRYEALKELRNNHMKKCA
jgi:hypothetical protein